MKDQSDAKERSFHFGLLNGVFASAMSSFSTEYFTPFLLLLGGTVRHVAFLSALPNLVSALVQLKGIDIAEKLPSRKISSMCFMVMQGVILVPIIFFAAYRVMTPTLFVVFAVMFAAFGAMAMPSFGSLLADVVPEKKRGAYIGRRNRIIGITTIIAYFAAAGILHVSEMKFTALYGFVLMFSLALVWRIVSLHYLWKIEEDPLPRLKEHHFTFLQFIRRFRESNFAQFVVFVSLQSFAAYIASPYFAVFMLKDLQFNYVTYILLTMSSSLMTFFAMGRWGKHADQVGNLKVIRLTAPLIGIIPLLWLVSHNPVYLIFAQLFSGFVWAGFNLCTSNFIYDVARPEKRARCIAYFNVINGCAISCGALIGGFLIRHLPPLFGHQILTLFVISALCRIAIGVFAPMRLKEVRAVANVRRRALFFSMIGVKPLVGDRRTIPG